VQRRRKDYFEAQEGGLKGKMLAPKLRESAEKSLSQP